MNQVAKILKEQLDMLDRLNKMEQDHHHNKDLFFETYEVIAEMLAWYSQEAKAMELLSFESAMRLDMIMVRARMIAEKAVLI